MKKKLVFILLLVAGLVLCACGGTDANSSSGISAGGQYSSEDFSPEDSETSSKKDWSHIH